MQIPQRKTSETEPEQNGTPHDAAKRVPFKKRTMKNLTEIKPDGNT